MAIRIVILNTTVELESSKSNTITSNNITKNVRAHDQ